MRPRQLLRLFPRGWRERYGDEFLATAEDKDLRLQQVIDIAACAIDAWTSPEVRRAIRRVRADGISGESLMLNKLMTSCGSTELVWNRRDAVLAALALIGGSIFFSGLGIVVKRAGFELTGEALVGVAFPGSLLLSMPFTYLKGKCWRTQLVLVGLPLLLLLLICFLAPLV